jgi:hypothetical protein
LQNKGLLQVGQFWTLIWSLGGSLLHADLQWNDKSIGELAKEFDVSYQTISKMAEIVRKDDASLCPKKDAVKVKREDIAKAAIALYKKENGKKS